MSDKPKTTPGKKAPAQKAPKIEKAMPGFFKAKYSLKQFESKILKRIYLPREREHILEFYEKKEDGYYLLSEYLGKKKSLTKKGFQRLDSLGKSIKKNGSLVDWFKVLLVGGLIAGVLVVLSFFLPGWTADFITSSMEGIFEARTDLNGFQLDILGGRVSFDNLAIADKANPMQNLFEMDQGAFSLNVEELASGRYHIESLKAEGIRWGTARAFSGALPASASNQGAGGGEASQEDGGIFGIFGGAEGSEILPKEITDLNPETLLQAQYDKLETPKILEEANTYYASVAEDYAQRVENTEEVLGNFQESVQVVIATDLSQVDTLQEVNQLIEDLEGFQKSFREVSDTVTAAAEQGRKDWEQVLSTKAQVTAAFTDDRDFLEGLVSLPLTGENSLASTLILNPIKQSLGDYYTLGKMALDFFQNLPKKADPEEEIPRQGRDISVPVPGKPAFLMKDVSFSLGETGAEGSHSLKVKNLSSNQELWPEPLEINYTGVLDGRALALDIQQDGLEDRLILNMEAGGFDFALDQGLDALGIGSLDGDMSFTGRWVYDGEDSSRLNISLQFSNLQPSYVDRGEITNLVRGVFNSKNDFLLNLGIVQLEGGIELELSSDADRVIGETVSRWINEQVTNAQARLRGAFEESISDLVGENDALAQEINDLLVILESGEDSLAVLERRMDQKMGELSKRVAEFAAEEAKKLIPGGLEIPNFGF
jgi:uncharacterized protein (TIGR03545 family)